MPIDPSSPAVSIRDGSAAVPSSGEAFKPSIDPFWSLFARSHSYKPLVQTARRWAGLFLHFRLNLPRIQKIYFCT